MSEPKPDYLLSMSDNHYPLTAEYSADADLNNILVDLYFVSDLEVDNDYVHSASTYISRIISNGTNITRVLIGNGTQDIFDTTDAAAATPVTFGDYTVYEWVNETLSATLKLVVHTENMTTKGAFDFTDDAELAIRNVEIRPKKLTAIGVNDGGLQKITGDVQIKSGYNIQTDVAPLAGPRHGNRIVIDAVPGAGEGKFNPNCTEESALVLRSINGIRPANNGQFLINPKSCYWWSRPSPYTITLYSDCQTCFDCADVESAYTSLSTLYSRAQGIRNRICNAILVYQDYVNAAGQFIREINKTKATFSQEQTDDDIAIFAFRLQTGKRRHSTTDALMSISDVAASITFDDVGVSATYLAYSGRRKLPGLAPVTFAPDNGTTLTYTNNPSLGSLGPSTYAYWYWAVMFDHSSGPGSYTFDTSATFTVNWPDGQQDVFNLGPSTISIVIPADESSSGGA